MLNQSRTRRAFTLLELLTVLAMMALLIGILIPTMSRARAAARVVQCSGNLHQIDAAWRIWQQDKRAKKSYMHLPQTFSWITAVQTVTKEDRILYCPDGGRNNGPNAAFATPDLTQSKRWSGKGHPIITWTPDPATSPNADKYTGNIQYHNVHPGTAVVVFTRLYGNYWQAVATRIDDGGAWGGPPIDLDWGGVSFPDLQVGQTYYNVLGTPGGTNYGYNSEMSDVKSPKPGKVLAMDYDKMWIDYDGLNADDDDVTKYLVGRHTDKRYINVLFSDSSVRLMPKSEMKAATGVYHNY